MIDTWWADLANTMYYFSLVEFAWDNCSTSWGFAYIFEISWVGLVLEYFHVSHSLGGKLKKKNKYMNVLVLKPFKCRVY